ncbi:MAG: hypothetical protein HYX34_03580 [Actinobacteria bacterium]|nr:hypothetical protein [Actinomycetota bacterium]
MELLVWLLGGMLAAALVALAVLLVVLARLRRRNRVSPKVRTAAPTVWLWSPALAARLHRRLRDAVAVSRMVAGRHTDRSGGVADLAARLEQEALAVDGRIAAVGRLAPRLRRTALPALAADVAAVERLASDLSLLGAAAGATRGLAGSPAGLDALGADLARHVEAQAELARLEGGLGLDPVSRDPAVGVPPRPRAARPAPPEGGQARATPG